jgi:hypothetical protein
MSVANLVAPGRQSSANVNVNTLKFAELSTVERLALTPAEGLMVYDTTINELYVYNGSWSQVTTSSPTGTALFSIGVTATQASTGVTPLNILANNSSVILGVGFDINTVTGVLTPLASGTYSVNASVTVTVVGAVGAKATLFLYKNGAAFSSCVTPPYTTTTQMSISLSAIIPLTTTDTLSFVLVASDAAGVSIINDGGVPGYDSFVSGTMIS